MRHREDGLALWMGTSSALCGAGAADGESNVVRWMIAYVLVAWLMDASGCAGRREQVSVGASFQSPHAVTVSYFYDSLDPYGRWMSYSPYGRAWIPAGVPLGWRPYSNGYWLYTDYGWTWGSYEPWGWATYHYGRWVFDPGYGWVWIPGTVWAPAWVAWRYDDDWVGWAPLPPEAGWNVSIGLQAYDSNRIPSERWCFVRSPELMFTSLRYQVVPASRNAVLIARTRDATRFGLRRGHPMNRGIDAAAIGNLTGRRVLRLKVVDAGSPERGRGQFTAPGRVGFFRPEIRREGAEPRAKPHAQRNRDAASEAMAQRLWGGQRIRRESPSVDRGQEERIHEPELGSAERSSRVETPRRSSGRAKATGKPSKASGGKGSRNEP